MNSLSLSRMMYLALVFGTAAHAGDVPVHPCLDVPFRHELQAEAQHQLALEGLRPEGDPMHRADYELREHAIIMNKLAAMEPTPEIEQILWFQAEQQTEVIERHRFMRAQLAKVATETIEEAVRNLREAEYHKPFSYRFTRPWTLDSTLHYPPAANARHALTDPRAARLMRIAESGTPWERAALLAAIEADFAMHGVGDRESSGPAGLTGINGRPQAVLPLLIAALDEHGEQLPFLLHMLDDYFVGNPVARWTLSNAIAEQDGRLREVFPGLVALAAETVLENRYQACKLTGETPPRDLVDYIALRENLRMAAQQVDIPEWALAEFLRQTSQR